MNSFLQMRGITKRFHDNIVLNGVNFDADKGQVHALVGENGAGKSTLMKILAGLFEPDAGDILIEGKPVTIQSPKQAQELGIAMIHQEIRLFQDLDIAENVFIRREPIKKWSRLIDWDMAYKETRGFLDRFGLMLSPRTPVKSLSAGQQKLVEIIKAIAQNARIMIMDEPTAALSNQEIELLFQLIRDLKNQGVTFIYISHRIEEIVKIADRFTVIRDGEAVHSSSGDRLDLTSIVRTMVGKELSDRYPKLKVKPGKELLRVENVSYCGRIRNICLDVKAGEMIGLTGLSGSGRRTLAKVLFGINGPFEGRIVLQGKTFTAMTPHAAKQNGLCYVSGTHADEGLIAGMSITENITLANLERVSLAGFLNAEAESRYATDLLDRLEIGTDADEDAESLSGGKQKKVIFAKWLFAGARVLIVDEPTAGIDIVSKLDIYNMLNELVLSGAAVIIVSSDLSEVLGMCDRIAVMYNGEIRKVFSREEATQEKLLYYASGGRE